jgi:DNA modification methylase
MAASLKDILAEMTADPYNMFSLANTKSSDLYQDYCRSNGITPHPARMPTKLVEFFIRFLTDANDLVLDPFAGSNTTGAVAESQARQWIAIEIDREYIKASRARFPGPLQHQMSIWAGRHLSEPRKRVVYAASS